MKQCDLLERAMQIDPEDLSAEVLVLLTFLIEFFQENNMELPAFMEEFLTNNDVVALAHKAHTHMYFEGMLPQKCVEIQDQIFFAEEGISESEIVRIDTHKEECPLCRNIDPESEDYLGLGVGFEITEGEHV